MQKLKAKAKGKLHYKTCILFQRAETDELKKVFRGSHLSTMKGGRGGMTRGPRRGFVGSLIEAVPGKSIFGMYRFMPFFFALGAALEFTMINWEVNGNNFCKFKYVFNN